MSDRSIAVIGAGAAGLCAAKYLLEDGHDVAVYEIGSQVGGLWKYQNDNGRSSAYASLHINSEKRNTQFSDYPFAPEVPVFPSHEDMARYLESYARHFGVMERIRFSSPVVRIEPTTVDGARWELETEDGDVEAYDSVVVASGHLSDPSVPPFLDDFAGQALHSHDYEVPLPFAGKKVLVVGAGNSACDIAADLCQVGCETVMSVRSPVLIVPKLVLGKPVTRIVGLFEKPWLPSSAVRWARKIVTRIVHGPMESLGLTTPKGRTHPISHPTLVNHIAYRRVRVKPGVQSVDGAAVTFDDGSREEFDTIIAATGYEMSVPGVSDEILKIRDDGGLDLYKRIIPPDWPGLYLLGFFNTDGSSNLRMFEVQMKLVRALENGRCSLPSPKEMRKDIEAMDAWVTATYPAGPRHILEIDPTLYTKDINKTIRRCERQGPKDADGNPTATSSDSRPGGAYTGVPR